MLSRKQRPQRLSNTQRILGLLTFFTIVTVMAILQSRWGTTQSYVIAAFGALPFVSNIFRMCLAFLYRPSRRESDKHARISVCVSSYNDSPESVMKTVLSILAQSHPAHEILFYDDGSKSDEAFKQLRLFAVKYNKETRDLVAKYVGKRSSFPIRPLIVVYKAKQNMGKRKGLEWCFRKATGSLLLTIDSDGELSPYAVEELLRPLANPKVMGVTGMILPRNHGDSWLTKAQGLLYTSAFRVGRGAMSVAGGCVVSCSGALTLYRKDVIEGRIDEFANDTLFGRPNHIGDDRRLTMMALEKGKVVFQSTAEAYTDVPTSAKILFKQQVRWSKSTFVESWRSIPMWMKRPWMAYFIITEATSWAIFGGVTIWALFSRITSLQYSFLPYVALYMVLTTIGNSIFYLVKYPSRILIAPLLGMLQMIFTIPVRVYALATLNSNAWGTRK